MTEESLDMSANSSDETTIGSHTMDGENDDVTDWNDSETSREQPTLWWTEPRFNHYWRTRSVLTPWLSQYITKSPGHDPGDLYPEGDLAALTAQFQSHLQHTYLHYWLPRLIQAGRDDVTPRDRKRRSTSYMRRRMRKIKGRNRKKRREARREELRNLTTSESSEEDDDYSQECDDEDEGSLVCDMPVTEEMLEFFRVTAQHRAERDLRRRTDQEEDLPRVTWDAPTSRPGSLRTREMRQLYGACAAQIQGMETALQLSFDRNLDLKKPRPWPALQLNLKYDNSSS